MGLDPGTLVLLVLLAVLVLLGALETAAHKRHVDRIPIRIHVNGTRGKSSVTRLIAAGLREGGIVTCGKTTGTLPRLILPDGSELPVYRPSKANIIEQVRIMAAAAELKAEALVVECMALHPEFQWLSESKLVRATHGVITNARPDHLDVMGPAERDVAWALAGMIPRNAVLYTAEQQHLDVFTDACRDRGTTCVAVGQEDVAAVTEADLSGFGYSEHAENVALALQVCAALGVDRATALRGMWKAAPDPGALTEHSIEFFGRRILFVNGFAANDPVSTERIWRQTLDRHPDVPHRVAVFNCRADRPDRSLQLGVEYLRWPQADHVLLMGSGTYIFGRAAIRAGLDPSKLVFAEDSRADEVFETIVSLVKRSSLVMGMGNIGGPGLDLVHYFENRAAPPEEEEVSL